jgi:hypothetical protein
MPHHAHVGEEEGAQVALLRRQVPHTADLGEDLLLRQHDQLSVLDDGASQLEVAVQLGGLVRPAPQKTEDRRQKTKDRRRVEVE